MIRVFKNKIVSILATATFAIVITQQTHAETKQYSGNAKKLNDEAAAHEMDGFLDTTDGKPLTCKEAEEFKKSHDASITMPLCKISGQQAIEKARKENRDITKTTWIDGCVEGSCKVGIWRNVHH